MDEYTHSIAQSNHHWDAPPIQSSSPTKADFLQYLAVTLANYAHWPLDRASQLAHRLYDQVLADYQAAGCRYGPTHAGMMRWVAEVMVD